MTDHFSTYNAAFLKALQEVNASQREAIEHIEGPVMVVAGPGTGKTHILAARIGHILLHTDAQPANILCLTFTEAGVKAMRQRLLTFIGPEAHRVPIHTFHSFCNKVIRENLELFGRQELEPVSQLEKIEMIRELLDELPANHPLNQNKSSGGQYYSGHLSDLFTKMKTENWSPEFISEKVKEYLDSLPTRDEFIYQKSGKGFSKGDLKTWALEDEAAKMSRLVAAAELFPKFENLMHRYSRYDYEDMILWVLRAFRSNEYLLRNYQERFLYFLVDEYQDTNGSQNEVLKLLISYWDKPNVFIVGDDDQSIYEFQGARLKSLAEFFFAYADHLKVVVLKDNYRSSQAILDSARTLIEHNEIRIIRNLQALGLDKVLVARNDRFVQASLHPRIVEYPNRMQETADIIAQLEVMHQDGFPLQEVAVIYAEHKQSADIAALLERKKIPFQMRRKQNILDFPVIQQLTELLEYIQTEQDRPFSGESKLFRLLHFEFFGLELQDIARLATYRSSLQTDQVPHWRVLLGDKAVLSALKINREDPFIAIGQLLSDLIGAAINSSLPHLIEKVINRTGLLAWAVQQVDRQMQVQALTTFLDFLQNETNRAPRITLKRLLDILRRMQENRIPIEFQDLSKYGELGVNLLTAHSAKGLEFERVFVVDCVAEAWEPRSRQANYRFVLPDTLTFSGEEDAMEARRRLFYVAMTRAKEQLILTYSLESNNGKSLNRSIFLDEICTKKHIEIESIQLDAPTLTETQILLLKEKEPPYLPQPDREVVAEIVEHYILSISGLNRFLDCPLSFYFEYILKAPAAQSEAANYGSAMHAAMHRLFEKMLDSKQKAFPTVQAFEKMFEKEMQRRRGYFSEGAFDRRVDAGKQHLKAYYLQNVDSWHRQVKVEYRINNVVLDGVPLTGVLDKVEFHDEFRVRIVDYKTGNLKQERLRKPSEKNPNGGSYWRQMVFYKLLFEHYGNTPYIVDTTEINYLEPQAGGTFDKKIFNIGREETEQVKAMIRQVYQRIRMQDFYTGCGKPDCVWCHLIRLNVAPASLSNPEIESLDDQ